MRQFLLTLGISGLAVATLVAASPLALAAASDWQDLGGGKARLIAAKDPVSGALDGVIEVRLDDGWKTYWRSPGSSGIAPEFDFSASRGSFVDHVNFPVPQHISAGEDRFYGYRGTVLFTFSGMAEMPDNELSLDMLIGVCEEICIPASAHLAIRADALDRSDPLAGRLVTMARSFLPEPADDRLKAVSAHRADDRIVVEIEGEVPEGETVAGIVWQAGGWNSDPVPAERQGDGSYRLSVPLHGNDTGGDMPPAGWHYTLLVESGDGKVARAVEGRIAASQ
ncbi:MAG: hypothetical protein KDJ80_07460 [Nitratireductor sp.]|nr:hypothetical protein [Nitratireductor sp.]